ncbi:MAG TPA: mannitol dehydrogenase family protein [Casimicrobiaceae bacterium]|nr:mannitol dehydrogenase family protein [Casimicrobiaceae bacterium]
MERRLSLATLPDLPATVERPAYDPARVAIGIVHLGLGAFHRAHQAVFTDALLARDPRWGILGTSMKTPRATRPLAEQDGLYTVLTRGEELKSARVVGAIRATAFAGDPGADLVARIADPKVTVVSLTVTEKGYCHDPASGRLDFSHPDIVHDVESPRAPRSVVGLLVAALDGRRLAGSGRLNVVCCDNLPRNGRVVEGLVGEFAARRGAALADWIAENAAFPGTMVDRIVPATTEADTEDVERMLGVHDGAAVVAEPYNQWVVEDRFVAPRPAWEDAGATLTRDIEPFETLKLRMLNGSHSTLAYLGFLAGHETIAQAARDPPLATFVERQMREEIAPTLQAPSGVAIDDYALELGRRFRNPALPHRTRQVAMDGSQKLPQRLLNTIREDLAVGRPIDRLALSVAGWMRYVHGRDEHGRTIDVADPLASRFSALATEHLDAPAAFARALIDIDTIFGRDLREDPRFVDKVTAALESLFANGVRSTVERTNQRLLVRS